MNGSMRKKTALLALALLTVCGATACQWESVHSDKAFLSYKYKLEACADIHGQDPYSQIWFSDYKGDSYSDLFDLSFDKTYLDFKVEIIEGRAVGKGHLQLTWKNGNVFEDRPFEYWCTAISNNWGGNVYASDVPETYGTWVYSIYWCRLNMEFVVPDTQKQIVLTFHFRGGEGNPAPQEFSQGHL